MAKILIIDDASDIREALEIILSDHEITTHLSGKNALNALCDTQFDLVITDILMPDTDGFDVIKFIQQMANPPKVIAMSGGGVTLSSQQALDIVKENVSVLLEKPFSKDTLQAVVNDVLSA
mgnify:CR=1 FL=1